MKIKSKDFLIMSLTVVIMFVLFLFSYDYDTRVINYLKDVRTDRLNFWMLFITNFGNVLTFLVVTLFSFFILNYQKSKKIIYALIISFSTSFLLKYIIARPRPLSMLVEEYGFSFPSAHALVSFSFYGYLCYLINKSNARKGYKVIYTILTILVILGIGISRVYLGVHYLSDVMGGYLFGLITLYLFIYFSNKKYRLKDETIRLDKSFHYAFNGINDVMIHEKNMHIHIIAAVSVLTIGSIVGLSKMEWVTCLILFALVMSAEIFNTAMEKMVDYISKERTEQAKLIKDMAAGAVLINAIAAFIIGLYIFIPRILEFFGH